MYSGIKSSRNGYHSIAYPMTEKRNQTTERIGAFRCGGGIIDTGSIKGIREQFARVWKRGKREIGDIQVYNILYSFSSNELDPANEESLEVAADIVASVMDKIYSGHQWTLVAQRDGKGGKVHVHATVNALASETLKACRGRQTSYITVREEIESEMEQYGIQIDHGKNHGKAEKKRKEKTTASKKKDANNYSWLEDVAARIQMAISQTTRFDELEENLERYGVRVTRKTRNNWTFTLLDAKDKKYIGKKVRGDKMGSKFVPGEMRRIVDANYKQMAGGSASDLAQSGKDGEPGGKQNPGEKKTETRHDKQVRLAEELEEKLLGRVYSKGSMGDYVKKK